MLTIICWIGTGAYFAVGILLALIAWFLSDLEGDEEKFKPWHAAVCVFAWPAVIAWYFYEDYTERRK